VGVWDNPGVPRRPFRKRRSFGADPTTEGAPAAADNLAYNRFFWDWYSERWEDEEWRDAYWASLKLDRERLEVLGDEWSEPQDVEEILETFIVPYLSPDAEVAEVGPGGGRLARRVAPQVGRLVLIDISPQMLDRCREVLRERKNVEYVLLEGLSLPEELSGRFDFVYAFDVYVHFDMHSLWRHLQGIERLLRPGAHALIHTANLTAPLGWANFASQERYTVEGHFPLTPEAVRTLVSHTRLQIVRESEPTPGNMYLNRDYLAVLRLPT
jgi:SAM-dependent methyltransferase